MAQKAQIAQKARNGTEWHRIAQNSTDAAHRAQEPQGTPQDHKNSTGAGAGQRQLEGAGRFGAPELS